MSELTKASLQVLVTTAAGSGNVDATVKRGARFEVQLNPTSMRVDRKNNIDRGAVTAGGQRRQHTSTEGATLTFDLEYDTADEIDVDVRDKTKDVHQFTLPGEKGEAPPRLEFQWGTFVFRGIMTSLVEELDFFSAEGRPLHAKLSVTITEQNLAFEKKEDGPGLRTAKGSTPPDAPPSTGPGGSGTQRPETRAQANDGETAQQLAARLGGDPTAWRSLMNGLDSPLAIPAGATIEVGPELAGGQGIALTGGVAAGLATTETASLSAALQPTADAQAGFSLAEIGGVTVAAQIIESGTAQRAVAQARASFDVPSLRITGATSIETDPRSATYGASIPLRLHITASSRQEFEAAGDVTVAARARHAEIAVATSASMAPWVILPVDVTGERGRADSEQRFRDGE
jgi:Contractile injection system tube protein